MGPALGAIYSPLTVPAPTLDLQPMPRAADKIPDNIEFAAQELLEAPAADRPAMLDIAKALTRRLLKDNPGIGMGEVQE
jgi:hypothetical protein